jgi:hypothetical protein
LYVQGLAASKIQPDPDTVNTGYICAYRRHGGDQLAGLNGTRVRLG